MLTLSLLRHAKSSWSDARLKDIARPLNARGERDAPRMGAFMVREGEVPDFILCSPAVRTRQTLALVLEQLGTAPQVVYEDALYPGDPAAMLKRLNAVGAAARHAMIVGHNPALHALARDLAGDGAEAELAALAEKLPTAGLVVIALPAATWAVIKPGSGRLKLFMSPKRLA